MSSETTDRETKEAPLGEILAETAGGLIEAQMKLEDEYLDRVMQKKTDSESPPFYRFSDTSIDLKLALHMEESQDDGSLSIYAAPVNADYCNEYQYDPLGASCVNAKLVPKDITDDFEGGNQ